jgi:hypothetical protein
MLATPRIPAFAACLAAFMAATVAPAAEAEWRNRYLEPAIQAWMGVVTMLAEDGEREEGSREPRGRDRGHRLHDHGGPGHRGPHHGRMHAPDHPHRHHMGPPRPESPRTGALSMLHDISDRLARIERMLAARAAGGPGRGEWRGPGRPEMSSEAREMMEARRARMKAARDKWEQASPEEREEMKKKCQERRGEASRRMEDATPRMEGSRPRGQDMEARIEQLEAEITRLKQALEEDD